MQQDIIDRLMYIINTRCKRAPDWLGTPNEGAVVVTNNYSTAGNATDFDGLPPMLGQVGSTGMLLDELPAECARNEYEAPEGCTLKWLPALLAEKLA